MNRLLRWGRIYLFHNCCLQTKEGEKKPIAQNQALATAIGETQVYSPLQSKADSIERSMHRYIYIYMFPCYPSLRRKIAFTFPRL